jgi:prolyl-tRNA synthetase
MLGVMVAIHGDNKGLVLPPKMAANRVVIVPIIYEGRKDETIAAVEKIREYLAEFDPIIDDRDGYSPGWKFNEWELKGIPVRIEVGPKDLDSEQATVVVRDNGEKQFIKIADLKAALPELMKQMHDRLYEKSKEFLESSIIDVADFDQFKKAIADKKMARALFCGEQECEDWIKDESGGAKSTCIPLEGSDAPEGGVCVHCAKPAKYYTLFAKVY